MGVKIGNRLMVTHFSYCQLLFPDLTVSDVEDVKKVGTQRLSVPRCLFALRSGLSVYKIILKL
jgi:hypothetical protein